VIGAGAGIYFSQKISPKQKAEEIEKPAVEEKLEQIKTYSMIALNEELKEKLDKKLFEISEIYREAKENPDLIETISFIFSNSFGFEYLNNKYVVSFDHSGGAHCCGDAYVFRLDEYGELNLLEPSAPIRVGGNISPLELKEKDNKLYLVTTDDRFAYYPGSYARSPFFKRYFLIERDKLLLANTDWKNEFIQAAQEAEERLENLYEEVKTKKEEYYLWEIWTQPLIEKVANYMVAREDEKAWENFDKYFEKFSDLIPPAAEYTAEKVRNDILKIMEAVPY
jgi:vacuolar-type H+-ATPase subunit I/STV1